MIERGKYHPNHHAPYGKSCTSNAKLNKITGLVVEPPVLVLTKQHFADSREGISLQ